MTPDEMKQLWQQLNANPQYNSENSSNLIDRVTSGRISSARDRLMHRYRMMFAVICPIGMIASIPVWSVMQWWQVACILLFFAVAACMDAYLYFGIKSIDPVTEGVQRVADRARYYRKRHWIFQGILMPMAAALVMIYFSLFDDPWYHTAMWVGAGIGLVIGLLLWLQMMRDYKKML